MYIIGFSGSRNYIDYNKVKSVIEILINKYNDIIIHVGDCKTGLDKIVKNICIDKNIKYKIFYANWNLYGKRAGPLRNKKVIENCIELHAFKCSDSLNLGTNSAIRIAESNNITTYIY